MKSSDESFQDSYFDDPSAELSGAPKKSRFVLLIGILISTLALGTTLATNVNLGSDNPLEFGQGVQLLTACSGSTAITVTPTREFINRAGAGDYFISGFTVTNVPLSCANKDFQIKTYDSATASALELSSYQSTNVLVNYNGTVFIPKGDSSCNYTVTSVSSSEFRISIPNPVETASVFSKLTLESGSDFPETETSNSGSQSSGGNVCTTGEGGPSISSIPETATAGSIITILGSNFTGDSVVKFWRNVLATPTNITKTQIVLAVPFGATTGKIIVTTPNGQAVSWRSISIVP